MAKKNVKKVKRVSDEAIVLEDVEDDVSILEKDKLQNALDKATVPLGFDANNDNIEQILFNGLEGRMLLVKVGSIGSPVDEPRLARVEEELSELIENFGIKCLLYVTGPDVDVKVVG